MSERVGGPNLKDLANKLRQVLPGDLSGVEKTPGELKDGRSSASCDKGASNVEVCVQEESSSGAAAVSQEDPEKGDLITEFRHEVESKHNTLLGKMMLLREALAKQLQKTGNW